MDWKFWKSDPKMIGYYSTSDDMAEFNKKELSHQNETLHKFKKFTEELKAETPAGSPTMVAGDEGTWFRG